MDITTCVPESRCTQLFSYGGFSSLQFDCPGVEPGEDYFEMDNLLSSEAEECQTNSECIELTGHHDAVCASIISNNFPMGAVKKCTSNDKCGTDTAFGGFSSVRFECDGGPELPTVDSGSGVIV